MDKYKKIISNLLKSGIKPNNDAEQRRKLFLTNALGLSLALISFLVMLNDYFFAGNLLAGHRRLLTTVALLFIPVLNKFNYHTTAKIFLVFIPGFTFFVSPIILKDFFPGQLLWFHYGTAIVSGLAILIFHHSKEKFFAIGFYLLFLIITIFIDDALLLLNPTQYEFEYLLENFTDYKLPPIFISISFALIVYWFNSINVRYSSRLKETNLELQQSNEELLTKTEQLDTLNRNLESLVKERAAIIAAKEKQIIEYANLNAHKVRGPLARILGLINLTEQAQDEVELKGLIEKMDFSAGELNDIITEMNKILSEAD